MVYSLVSVILLVLILLFMTFYISDHEKRIKKIEGNLIWESCIKNFKKVKKTKKTK